MYDCLSRSVPEIHYHAAGTLSKQPATSDFGYGACVVCFSSRQSPTEDIRICMNCVMECTHRQAGPGFMFSSKRVWG